MSGAACIRRIRATSGCCSSYWNSLFGVLLGERCSSSKAARACLEGAAAVSHSAYNNAGNTSRRQTMLHQQLKIRRYHLQDRALNEQEKQLQHLVNAYQRQNRLKRHYHELYKSQKKTLHRHQEEEHWQQEEPQQCGQAAYNEQQQEQQQCCSVYNTVYPYLCVIHDPPPYVVSKQLPHAKRLPESLRACARDLDPRGAVAAAADASGELIQTPLTMSYTHVHLLQQSSLLSTAAEAIAPRVSTFETTAAAAHEAAANSAETRRLRRGTVGAFGRAEAAGHRGKKPARAGRIVASRRKEEAATRREDAAAVFADVIDRCLGAEVTAGAAPNASDLAQAEVALERESIRTDATTTADYAEEALASPVVVALPSSAATTRESAGRLSVAGAVADIPGGCPAGRRRMFGTGWCGADLKKPVGRRTYCSSAGGRRMRLEGVGATAASFQTTRKAGSEAKKHQQFDGSQETSSYGAADAERAFACLRTRMLRSGDSQLGAAPTSSEKGENEKTMTDQRQHDIERQYGEQDSPSLSALHSVFIPL